MHTPETCRALGCATDPNRSRFHHSVEDEPMFASGYHWTYWPNLVHSQKGR